MWQVPPPSADHQFLSLDWTPVSDPEQRAALSQRWVERRSTPWSIAWHALECFDYDLSGEFEPWRPPAPFADHPHWRDLPSLDRPWTPPEIDGYVDYCRERLTAVLAEMTEEKAARLLPESHRYDGQPHAWIIAGMVGHTTEHASQIRQFSTAPPTAG